MSHNNLVVSAFEKAMDSLKEKGVVQPSKKAAAEILSDYIDGEFNFQFGERRLRDYFNATLDGEEVAIAQQTVRDGLAKYLGFGSYAEWAVAHRNPEVESESQEKPYRLVHYLGKNKMTLFFGLGFLVIFLIVNSISSEEWMKWDGDQFVETEYGKHQLEMGEIWALDKNRMDNFKKISPDCNTSFFDFNGNAKIWYGKNHKGELEFFTDLGRHPETGKTLRAITKYIIDKYICVDANRSSN